MYTKQQKSDIKNAIKTMVIEQKENRRTRKTVHLIGERTISAGIAAGKHSSLRYSLHQNYIAYAIMRGKSTEWIIQHIDKAYNEEKQSALLKHIIQKYGETVCIGS